MTANRKVNSLDLRAALAGLTKAELVDILATLGEEDPVLRERICRAGHIPNESTPQAMDARALLRAGRASQALESLRHADEHPILHSEILLALGRRKEAFEALWRAFQHTLSSCYLKSAMALAPGNHRTNLEADALTAAERHPDADRALGFLIAHGALDRAAKFIERRLSELGRTGLDPVADALSDGDPRHSWELLRLMLLDILEQPREEAFPDAAEHLTHMGALAEQGDFVAEHEAFLEQLQQEYDNCAAFWRAVEAARL